MRLSLPFLLGAALAAPASAADFRVMAGHGGPVMDVAVSADGDRALTASFDNAVGLWSLGGDEVTWLDGHTAAVKTVAWVDDTRAASGGDDFTIILWDLATSEPIARLTDHTAQISDLAVHGDLLASASWDGTVRLWDAETGVALATLSGHEGPVSDVAFSDDGTLYSASADGTIRTWNTDTGQEVRRLVNHGFGVNRLIVSDGWLAYGAVDGGTRVLDLATDETLADLTAGRRPILSMALSPDGAQLSVGDGEGYVMSVVTTGWRIAGDFKAAATGPVWALDYTGDAQSLIGGGIDDSAVIWPVRAELDAPLLGVVERGFLTDPTEMSNGERQFRRKCSICHSLDEDGGRKAGPTLAGVMGRAAGSVEGYRYSDTVAGLGFAWDETTIDQLFDIGPDHFIPGSKMPQQRITKPGDRADLIAYLKENT